MNKIFLLFFSKSFSSIIYEQLLKSFTFIFIFYFRMNDENFIEKLMNTGGFFVLKTKRKTEKKSLE